MITTFGWEGRPEEVFSAREEEYDVEELDEAELEEEDDEDDEDDEDEEEYGEFDDEESADELEDFAYYEETYDDEVSPRRRRREWG